MLNKTRRAFGQLFGAIKVDLLGAEQVVVADVVKAESELLAEAPKLALDAAEGNWADVAAKVEAALAIPGQPVAAAPVPPPVAEATVAAPVPAPTPEVAKR